MRLLQQIKRILEMRLTEGAILGRCQPASFEQVGDVELGHRRPSRALAIRHLVVRSRVRPDDGESPGYFRIEGNFWGYIVHVFVHDLEHVVRGESGRHLRQVTTDTWVILGTRKTLAFLKRLARVSEISERPAQYAKVVQHSS